MSPMFSRRRAETGAQAGTETETNTELQETAAGAGVDMATRLGAVTLPNPVMTASGCAGGGREMHAFFDITELGAFVTKTVMAGARSGRGTPRMAETASGMLNSIGLQGPGVESFCEGDLAWLASVGARVIASVGGADPREFGAVTRALVEAPAAASVAAIELNISCPNVANRGLVFACDPVSASEVVDRVRRTVGDSVPLFVKLSPDVTDIVGIARSVVHAGADGLTMVNTLLGIDIDTDRLRPRLYATTGGLSGPAIRPVAVRAVWQVAAAMREGLVPERPIIGVGGISTGADALQFVAAGASAVQVGTATFNDPHAPLRVRGELEAELARHGMSTLAEAVGIAHTRVR